MEATIDILDKSEDIQWKVELDEKSSPDHYILQSVLDVANGLPKGSVMLQLLIQKNPFKISAIRPVRLSPSIATPAHNYENVVVWETAERGLAYIDRGAAVLSIKESDIAKYMGFGEQGGKALFKKNTFMNYFSKLMIDCLCSAGSLHWSCLTSEIHPDT